MSLLRHNSFGPSLGQVRLSFLHFAFQVANRAIDSAGDRRAGAPTRLAALHHHHHDVARRVNRRKRHEPGNVIGTEQAHAGPGIEFPGGHHYLCRAGFSADGQTGYSRSAAGAIGVGHVGEQRRRPSVPVEAAIGLKEKEFASLRPVVKPRAQHARVTCHVVVQARRAPFPRADDEKRGQAAIAVGH